MLKNMIEMTKFNKQNNKIMSELYFNNYKC
jgi:hypothetical protein